MRILLASVALAACGESGSRPPCSPVQLARDTVWGGQLAIDDAFLYWMDPRGRVMRAARPDGAPALLDEPFTQEMFFQPQQGMVAIGGTVHWIAVIEGGSFGLFSTSGAGLTTRRVPGCFGPRLLADGDTLVALGCSDSSLLFLPPAGSPITLNLGAFGQGLTAGGGQAQTRVNDQIRSFAADGSSTLIAASTFALPIARHGDTLFVAEGGILSSVPLAGGTPTMIAELPGTIDPSSGAADETHVFVKLVAAGGAENDLFAVRRSGGEARFLTSATAPAEIVATDEGVYWAAFGNPPDGGVFQLDRCAYE